MFNLVIVIYCCVPTVPAIQVKMKWIVYVNEYLMFVIKCLLKIKITRKINQIFKSDT